MSGIYRSTRSKSFPLIEPPAIELRTCRLNESRFVRKSSAASLFNGSDAFGSRNRNYINPLAPPQSQPIPSKKKLTCIPTITAFKFNTGFQSSLKIFKQTFPSRSIFG